MTKTFIRHPKMVACDIERPMQIDYSLQTVQELQRRFPSTQFTWVAGMDNAGLFHKWNGWRELLKRLPFIFFNRPPYGHAVKNNSIRMYNGVKDVDFCLKGKTRNISSTQLRQKKIARLLKKAV